MRMTVSVDGDRPLPKRAALGVIAPNHSTEERLAHQCAVLCTIE